MILKVMSGYLKHFKSFVISSLQKNTKAIHSLLIIPRPTIAQFILKWSIENGQKPYCIYAGTKIMSMEIQALRIKCIDSLEFCSECSSLLFQKRLGLKELKKGYFPHYFNKECNQNYIGPNT